MQAICRQAARFLAKQTRGMTTKTAEEYWAPVFPKPHVATAQETASGVKKEMIGFLLLGPIGGGLMIYDFIYGLEEHSDNLIPPYPW
jgi:hypothetical protein